MTERKLLMGTIFLAAVFCAACWFTGCGDKHAGQVYADGALV